jgi:hypothetical protein
MVGVGMGEQWNIRRTDDDPWANNDDDGFGDFGGGSSFGEGTASAVVTDFSGGDSFGGGRRLRRW